MIINVTQTHIEAGGKRIVFGDECPVSLAIQEVLGHTDVHVTPEMVRIGIDYVALPRSARNFQQDGFRDQELKPFSFELDYDYAQLSGELA